MTEAENKLTVVRSKYNPEQTYEQFKEERLKGFGGSDIGSVMQEGEYACRRRLFLERMDLMPEDKNRLQFHLERGRFFEEPVAELFKSKHGEPDWTVLRCGTGYIKELPFIRANADRLLSTKRSGVGVLEIKCPAQWSFAKIKKEGLPKEYILQIQWQMLCYGTAWGAFCVYWPDGHELLWFRIERDEELIQLLLKEAVKQWECLSVFQEMKRLNELSNILKDPMFPEALPYGSKPCLSCPMKEKCHAVEFKDGVVISDSELEAPADRLLEVRKLQKELEKEEESLKDFIKSKFAAFPCDHMRAGKYKLKVTERSRESVLAKVKEVLTDEQKQSYVRNTSYLQVDIKENKE